MNARAKFFLIMPALVVLLTVALFTSPWVSHAEAARCGGPNQRACPALQRGPQCNAWLTKIRGVCRRCGGQGQRACPIIKAGRTCRPGLRRVRGVCVRRLPCGANGQRACRLGERVTACNRGLEKRRGRCVTRTAANCGALNQKPCRLVVGRKRCNQGLRPNITQTKCVRPRYSARELGRQCIRQYRPMAPAMARLARCLLAPPVVRVIKPLLDKKNGRLGNRVKEALLGSACAGQVAQLAATAARRGFRTISLGLGSQVGVGAGANSEIFIALSTRNIRSRAYVYESLGYQLGFGLGADISGVVTVHFKSPARLAGKSQTFSAGFKAVGGGGIAVGLEPRQGNREASCGSLGVSAGVGAAANAGSVGRSITVRLN